MTDKERSALEAANEALTAICTGKLHGETLTKTMEQGDFINFGGVGFEAWMKVRAALGESVFSPSVISDTIQGTIANDQSTSTWGWIPGPRPHRTYGVCCKEYVRLVYPDQLHLYAGIPERCYKEGEMEHLEPRQRHLL